MSKLVMVNNRLLKALLFCMVLCSLPLGITQASDDIIYASHDKGSSFHLLWLEILSHMPENVISVDQTVFETRPLFIKGEVMLECCINPIWRTQENEKNIQIFSDPITAIHDRLIIHPDVDILNFKPEMLARWRVAVVKGFSYQFQEHFNEIIEVGNMEEALDVVEAGVADVTIMNNQEFSKFQRAHDHDVLKGPEIGMVVIYARVHKKYAHILPDLNMAIKKVKQSGRVALLIGQAVRHNSLK